MCIQSRCVERLGCKALPEQPRTAQSVRCTAMTDHTQTYRRARRLCNPVPLLVALCRSSRRLFLNRFLGLCKPGLRERGRGASDACFPATMVNFCLEITVAIIFLELVAWCCLARC